jgi:hypothetical protein
LSASELSYRDLSLAVFITNIAESDFRYTHPYVGPWLSERLGQQVMTGALSGRAGSHNCGGAADDLNGRRLSPQPDHYEGWVLADTLRRT